MTDSVMINTLFSNLSIFIKRSLAAFDHEGIDAIPEEEGEYDQCDKKGHCSGGNEFFFLFLGFHVY